MHGWRKRLALSVPLTTVKPSQVYIWYYMFVEFPQFIFPALREFFSGYSGVSTFLLL